MLQDVGVSSQEGKSFSDSSAIEKSKQKQLGFPGGSVVNYLPANAVHAGLIPRLGRSPGERMETHSSILACKIPRTEEPG